MNDGVSFVAEQVVQLQMSWSEAELSSSCIKSISLLKLISFSSWLVLLIWAVDELTPGEICHEN